LNTETRPELTSVHKGTERGTLTKAARGKKFSLDPFFELFRTHYSSKFLQPAVSVTRSQRAFDRLRERRPASGEEKERKELVNTGEIKAERRKGD
jgi:hypothetical protein